MMDQVVLKKTIFKMETKFDKIIKFPIKVFNNKYVLKTAIYSCLLLYLTLSFANIISYYNKELFQEYALLYTILKDSVYQILLITSLGYFISKYKFCHWSLLSFYGVVYMKIVWFIDKYIYSFNDYLNLVDNGITIITTSMILYFLYKNYDVKI